jgi:hypothetical protein
LNIIKDFEQNMNCVGMCRKPRFWFFKEYFEGPPTMTCITSIKQELAEVNGALGYTVCAIAGLNLLLLFTICGICRSKDWCFQQARSDQATNELVDIELGETKLAERSFDNIAHDNSLTVDQNGGAGSSSAVEVPERAKRFIIR